MLDAPWSQTYGDAAPVLSTSESPLPPATPGETDISQSTLPTDLPVCKKDAALFVLKCKHIHKVSQRSLNGLLCDFCTMLELRVDFLKTQVDEVVSNDVKQQISTIFQSPVVTDPFCGLQTEHMQKMFFKDELHLVVCYIHASIFVVVDHFKLILCHRNL